MSSQLDIMTVRDMVFYGYHGVFLEETRLGQRFIVHLQGFFDASLSAKKDDLMLTADYGALYQVVKSIVEGPSVQLLETLAERIAMGVLQKFPLFHEVQIEVVKPQAPIPSFTGTVSIQVLRRREG